MRWWSPHLPRLARRTAVILGVVALLTGGAVAVALAHGESPSMGATGASGATGTTGAPTPPKPVAATKLTELPHSTVTDGTAAIIVRLSGVPAPRSARPWLEPKVAGSWATLGNMEIFTPASTLEPCTQYTLVVPAGTTAADHTALGNRRYVHFTVSCPSVSALQFALAQLDYLPYHFHSEFGLHFSKGPERRAEAAKLAFHPPHGHLVASVSDPPPVDQGSGTDGSTTGALEIFQADHGLDATGQPDAKTWASLLAAETLGHHDPDPYTWVSVDQSTETLEVHKGDHVALTSPANTGVAGAPTANGIFPIFARDVSTTMTGTNPDGSHYSDPGVPWVNYFNGGDAVHGFPRASYGSPQSDGCVELPIGTAETVYGMLAIGDIVWVY